MTGLPRAAAPLAGFARLLREAGFSVAPEQIVAFLEGVALLGPRAMEDIRQAALATLAVTPDRRPEFDVLFRAWFWDEAAATTAGDGEEETVVKDDRGGITNRAFPEEEAGGGERASNAEQLSSRRFGSGKEMLGFGQALPYGLPKRRSMRSVRVSSRGRPDLRRSLRLIVGADGDIPRPLLRRRPEIQRRLLLLIDISGSMKTHTAAHLELAHTVVRHADRAEVFTLGTRLTRITAPLRLTNRDLALERVAETVEDWDGGTRIGPTLLAFLSVPRFAALARGAAIVVLSDGLERGDHAEMELAFRRLKARAFRLSLLTPLAAEPRYQPRTKAISAILPYLDDLADGSALAPIADFILSLAVPARPARDVWREVS
ncbi:MAG: VWA domain-containing protein [Rhizobiaceae bacterium]|nr:VWA domain-containing protein [Rhizobiaceae bacterium]MCV0407905.1 VWA domain-containing protein [Rhizobiaceae bacterium]